MWILINQTEAWSKNIVKELLQSIYPWKSCVIRRNLETQLECTSLGNEIVGKAYCVGLFVVSLGVCNDDFCKQKNKSFMNTRRR